MSNQEILTKAIEKAIANGWYSWEPGIGNWTTKSELKYHLNSIEDDTPANYPEAIVFSIIFDHNFAKALWGEKWLKSNGPGLGDYDSNKGWQYHLQQMVIADDPIEYLGNNI